MRLPSRARPFLFDLDGTLADTIGDIAASANHVRIANGLLPHSVETVRGFVGDGAGTLLRRALPELGYPDDDRRWTAVLAAYAEHHAVQCTRTARLYPGVAEHLRRLRDAGHPLAVVTNKPERFAVTVVAHLGLADLLPVVVGGDTLPQKKPDPAPLWLALQRCGSGPGKGTMVGDGENDLRAGHAAGLTTIACLYGYRPEAALRQVGADLYWRQFGG